MKKDTAFRLLFVSALLAISASGSWAAEKTTAVWADGHTSVVSDEELMRNATASPAAGFPEEAQKKQLAGNGVYELQVSKNGAVGRVTVIKSSGSAVLDKAARDAFGKWRFKPGVFAKVRVPVSWQVNRVR
jgi:TonB family protein